MATAIEQHHADALPMLQLVVLVLLGLLLLDIAVEVFQSIIRRDEARAKARASWCGDKYRR